MGKYRTPEIYICPHCNMGGWRRRGEYIRHIKKSHPGSVIPETVSEAFEIIDERWDREDEAKRVRSK